MTRPSPDQTLDAGGADGSTRARSRAGNRPSRHPPSPAYLALTAALSLAGIAGTALTPSSHHLHTSPVFLWGLGLLVLAVPLIRPSVLRAIGTPLADPPEYVLTFPLLVVAPHPAYVVALAWVAMCACLRMRVSAVNTIFNLGATTTTSWLSVQAYRAVAGHTDGLVSPLTVLGAGSALVLGWLLMNGLVWLAVALDRVARPLPSIADMSRRLLPHLVSITVALCAVSLAVGGTVLGAGLALALLLIVLGNLIIHARAAHQRWLAEHLYAASERIRSASTGNEVPALLAAELATLWHSQEWVVTPRPSRDQESYQLAPGVYVAVRRGRAVASALTRPAASALATTAIEVMRSLEIEHELRRRATRDALTGLGTRQRLWDALEARLPTAGLGKDLVVLSLDVDSFKAINDAYGHSIGDQLLVAVAERLVASTSPHDVVARLASDEFVVVSEVAEGVGEALRRAHRLQQALSEPYELAQSIVNVTCSVGVHHIDHPTTRESALSAADAALMRAKKSGRGTVALATEEVVVHARRLLRLDAELRSALHQGEFTLHYQPIVDTLTGETFGVEALLRWQRDGVPQMGPADFIPYAEESGLISTIGLWVMRRACEQVNALNRTLPDGQLVRVSVNVSTVHIAQPTFVDDVRAILHETGLPPELLILEVTETFATLDLAASVETGRALRQIGVTLWLDDFGTGYSSLEYLRQLPVEVVKLDRSFLTDIDHDPAARDYVEAIVHLCRSIGRQPLAEGVELAEQRAILERLGCTSMQGYLFARPVPFDDLAHTLETIRRTVSGPAAHPID